MPTASSSFNFPSQVAQTILDGGQRSGAFTRYRCLFCNPDGRNKRTLCVGDRGWLCHACHAEKDPSLWGGTRRVKLTTPKTDPNDETKRQAKIQTVIEQCGFVRREGPCPVRLYLEGRRLKPVGSGWPSDLRRHNRRWHPDTRQEYVGMIGVHRTLEGMPRAIHTTYLMLDGRRADDPSVSPEFRVHDAKRSLGPLLGGAVRLGHVDDVDTMGVGEGIESTFALMMKLGVPCWAGLSAEGLAAIKIPPHIKRLVIGPDLGDTERNGKRAGSDAALRLQARILAEAKAGKRQRIVVEIRTPPLRAGRSDWANWAEHIAING